MVTHVETGKNIKDKRCCFVCLKSGRTSKNCTSKIQGYKCFKRTHIALCDFEQNENDKAYSQISNDCNQTCYNFIFPVNKVLLQTTIASAENDSFQYPLLNII